MATLFNSLGNNYYSPLYQLYRDKAEGRITQADYQTAITRVFPVLNISEAHPQRTYSLRPDSRLYIIPFPHSARDKNPNLTLNTDE